MQTDEKITLIVFVLGQLCNLVETVALEVIPADNTTAAAALALKAQLQAQFPFVT